jgi:hypothetical protein
VLPYPLEQLFEKWLLPNRIGPAGSSGMI